jgi:hypothetical protein
MDAAETRRLATREDDSRAAARATVVAAGIVSIGGVFLGILKAREVGGAFGAVIMIAAVVAIALAWPRRTRPSPSATPIASTTPVAASTSPATPTRRTSTSPTWPSRSA